MTPSSLSSGPWRRVRAWFRRDARERAVIDGGLSWYRAGYLQAIEDIERTGLRPTSDKAKAEFADRALRRWVEEP